MQCVVYVAVQKSKSKQMPSWKIGFVEDRVRSKTYIIVEPISNATNDQQKKNIKIEGSSFIQILRSSIRNIISTYVHQEIS